MVTQKGQFAILKFHLVIIERKRFIFISVIYYCKGSIEAKYDIIEF